MNYHMINITKNDTTVHVIVRPEFSDSEDLFDVLLQVNSNYVQNTILMTSKS